MNFLHGADPTIQPGNWAALPLRIITGLIFIYYGVDKLFNNGQWTGMNANFFTAVGLPFPELNQMAIGALELGGGLALLAGFMVKFFGIQLAGSMIVAMITVGDFQLEGILFAMAVAIFLLGAGPLSLDRVLGALRLPRPLQRLCLADANPFWGPAGWGALPLRVALGLISSGLGIAQLFVDSPSTGIHASTLTITVGAMLLIGGVLVLAGLLTKPAALIVFLALLIGAGSDGTLGALPGALIDFVTKGTTSTLASYFVLLPLLLSALSLIMLGAGPLSVDYGVQRTLARRPNRLDSDPAVSYGT